MKDLDTISVKPDTRLRGLLRGRIVTNLFALLFLAWFSVGCRGLPPQEIYDVVGPNPPRSLLKKAPGGSLVVYTAPDGFDTFDPEHERHTPYTIYANDGHLLQKVTNQTGSFASDPLTIPLPPGIYKVDGRAVNLGRVILSVQIEEGETTVVHLDGTGLERSGEGMVKLPNGQLAGWKAQR